MKLRLALLAGSLALAAGCGGGGGSATGADSAAGIVPETVPAFLSIDTDLSSEQLKSADEILKKFPIRTTP